ncbi:MAG: ABC transporter substrate-binding protein [Desulfobacteraceae bacterium]|nr:ABC transporter substrate-binding protein [Desulfobacteraceae bacterium]
MLAFILMIFMGGTATARDNAILKIGYSDWPGWVAWEIGIKKGWFKEAGVDARFFWYDYVTSMEAFTNGKLDAVCMTNCDALVTGASGRPGKAILVNDYSNGSDMIVARNGINCLEDLTGRKIALETGLLEQLLLRKALEKSGMTESDVSIVNLPTDKLPLALKLGKVDAVAAWQPYSGEALKASPGATVIFSSADLPGLIYDTLFVADESIVNHSAEWQKVVRVWFKIARYLQDPANKSEALKIMSARVETSPEDYEEMINGAHLLGREENKKIYTRGDGLDSLYGSTKISDQFNVSTQQYNSSQDVSSYIHDGFIK